MLRRALGFLAGIAGDEGGRPRRGGMDRGGRGLLHAALKGAGAAARQLPGSHAVAGGELPACLAWEEDALAPLGWASSAGPGGPEVGEG